MQDLFQTQAVVVSAGTNVVSSGTVIFSNANGVSFGANGQTVTASAAGGAGAAISALGSSQNAGTIVFSNANGVSFGMNGSTVTGTVATNYQSQGAYLTTAMLSGASTQFVQANATIAGTNITGTIASNGLSLSVAAPAGGNFSAGVSNAGNTAGNTGVTGTRLVFVGTNNITLSQATDANGATISFSAGPTDVQGMSNLGNTSGTSGTVNQQMVFVGTNGIGLSQSVNGQSATLSIQQQPLSRYGPYDQMATAGYTSFAPASWNIQPVILPSPVALSQVNFFYSIGAGVPGATSQASTGTARISYQQGLTIFTRNGFGINSSQISYLTSASFGLTAGLSYSSTSQSFVMSWVTDSTGGTTSFNTTSNNAGWSNWISGRKFFGVPLVGTLSAGEYFFVLQASTTTGTTQSNVTLASFSNGGVAQNLGQVRLLGSSANEGALGWFGGGFGRASAITTNATMALTVFSNGIEPSAMFYLQNGTGF